MILPHLSAANLLEDLRASFWALPLVGLALGAALALGAHALDVGAFAAPTGPVRGFAAAVHPDTVRRLLATLATAAAGVAGIAFSVTITTLTLASQQFGPHVLRTYMRRRFVQAVLASLVGTVLAAFVALHLLGAAERTAYLPVATAALALGLAALDLALLVGFVHVTAASIRADSIIESVLEDHGERLEVLFPTPGSGAAPAPIDPAGVVGEPAAEAGEAVRAHRAGYLQSVDRRRLVALAGRHDARVVMRREPGAWVNAGETLATVHAASGDAAAPGAARERAGALLVLGSSPTPEQDPRFALRQLHQIAQRALSPALNDPQTAASCIARIGAIASDLLARERVHRHFVDAGGTVRLIECRSDPGELLAFAFDAVVRDGAGRPDTAADLLATIGSLATLHPDTPWRGRLEDVVGRIEAGLADARLDRHDAERLAADLAHVRGRLSGGGGAPDGPDAADGRHAPDARPAREARRVSSSRGGARGRARP